MSTRAPLVFAAMIGVATLLWLTGCDNAANSRVQSPPPAPTWITVVTPHNERIQSAFQAGFSDWYNEQHGESVYFNWIKRGTPECLSYVALAAQDGGQNTQLPDLMFGGGIADHMWLQQNNYSRPAQLKSTLEKLPVTLDDMPLYDKAGHWFATSLSSFGMLCNAHALAAREIAAPATWTDLADPRFAGWIGMASPSVSGSTRECLLVILQDQGWEQGWQTITQILANAPALVDGSGVALHQVETGVSLVTFAVNFDGLALAAASDGHLNYVQPSPATLVSPNAVSLLKSAEPSRAAIAEEFVRFVLSESGQKLWGLRADAVGNAETLYHYPILPSVYENHKDDLALTDNPLQNKVGTSYDPDQRADYSRIMLPLVSAIAKHHIPLQRAMRVARETGRVDELARPLLDEHAALEAGARFEAADEAARSDMIAGWAAQFAARFAAMMQQ